MQEATAIDGDGGFEAVIDGGDDAGGITAPTDAGDGGAIGIHLWKVPDEGMSADDGGDGVVGPVVREGGGDHAVELFRMTVVGSAVGEAGAGVGLASVLQRLDAVFINPDGVRWSAAGEVHGDGGITALCPKIDPVGKSRATPAVDEDDARETALGWGGAGEGSGRGVEGEDFGGFVLVGLAIVKERSNGAVLGDPAVSGRRVKLREVPRNGSGVGGVHGADYQ